MSPRSPWNPAPANGFPRRHAALKRRMAVAVVRCALLRIAQHLVRLAARLELLLGLRIVRVPVRMVLHRQPPVAGLQLLVARVPRNLQHLIKISLGHVCRRTHLFLSFRCLSFPQGICFCTCLFVCHSRRESASALVFMFVVRALARHSGRSEVEGQNLHISLLLSLPLSLFFLFPVPCSLPYSLTTALLLAIRTSAGRSSFSRIL